MRWAGSIGSACVLALSVVTASASAEPPPEASVARAEIDNTLSAMRLRAHEVQALLREARRHHAEGDAIACFDETLSRCNAAVRHARDFAAEANAAYARGDLMTAREARRHLADEELLQLVARRDARACQ